MSKKENRKAKESLALNEESEWLDVCADQKDYLCINKSNKSIIRKAEGGRQAVDLGVSYGFGSSCCSSSCAK